MRYVKKPGFDTFLIAELRGYGTQEDPLVDTGKYVYQASTQEEVRRKLKELTSSNLTGLSFEIHVNTLTETGFFLYEGFKRELDARVSSGLKNNSLNIYEMSDGTTYYIAKTPPEFEMIPLTRHQCDLLRRSKEDWRNRKLHISNLAKSFGIDADRPEVLEYLMEKHLPAEWHRLAKERREKIRTGVITNKYTPTEVGETFAPVVNPRIHGRYHISWAYRGAVFVLVKMEGDTCYMDNPKRKRKILLKCKISDLRSLRTRQ